MATGSQQKQELFKAIWATAEDLRNSVDGWDFKSYVLGILFYRFISENITNYINRMQREAGDADFDYADFSDEEAAGAKDDLVREKGFFILPSQLFCNVRKRAKNDPNLNVTLDNTFKAIEASAIGTESEPDLKGLFADIDVNSNKLGSTVEKRNEQMTKILNNIGNIDLKGDYAENKIDLFGDAYEFLMSMYASNAGKSGGEYYTPQEVSELLARIVCHGREYVNKVYDPACGSGSLLLKFAKVLGAENVKKGFFGQELNITTYNLCRINMFLHNINYNNFDIQNGDTLLEPAHWDDEPFDAIVSNPPLLHKMGRRRQSPAHQRSPLRPRRCSRSEKQERPRLYDAHAPLAVDRRHCSHCRIPRRSISRRQGTENQAISHRQQLCRHRHSAPAKPVLRCFDRYLHNSSEEVKEGE